MRVLMHAKQSDSFRSRSLRCGKQLAEFCAFEELAPKSCLGCSFYKNPGSRMIRFIHEVVCRWTLTVTPTRNKCKMKIYVTTIAGEVGNWRLTHVAPTHRGETRATLSVSEEEWANQLDEKWQSAGREARPIEFQARRPPRL